MSKAVLATQMAVPKVPMAKQAILFLVALGLASAGAAWGFLDIMAAAVIDGGESEGATYAGAYLALQLVFTSIAIPQVAKLCRRLGEVKAFRLAHRSVTLIWALAGSLMLMGYTEEWLLLVFAPFFGALMGFTVVLNPLIASRLMPGEDTSRVSARMSAVGGIGWGGGALIGGWITSHSALGWGVLAAGLSVIPLALLSVQSLQPEAKIAAKLAPKESLGTWQLLKKNRDLLTVALLSAGLACFSAPLIGLTVPVAEELYHREFISSASIIA